jgi:V8-like Glu-specific endopeptidase
MAGSIIFEYDFNDLKNIIVTKKIEDVKESIVKVVVYNNDNEELATGSGVCVFDNNMIITNFHVIEGASKIQIITNAKETYNINKINAFNKKQDIALISLQPIAIGNVNHIAVGQNITAIGSPEGQLNTMSTGIISNIDNDYDIGISTPISPGSSGGALLNKKNQLIGITYATYNSSDAQNLNYAINVNYVKRIYNAYKNDECKIISDSKVSNFVKELEYSDTFENSLFYYYVDSFSTWKTLTDDETKFSNFLMSQENGQILQGIFTSFSTEERYTIIKLYKEMTEYESKSLRDISNISVYDAILDTNIISKYEFAMIIDDYSNSNNIENIINKYPMQTGEDIFLRLVYGNLKHLSNSQYNKLSKFIFNNCSNNAQIAWFTLFGYEISYDTNGNVKSVTWYY